MRRVTVTGGSGLLGRFVVDELIDHGYDVEVLDIVAPVRDVRFHAVDILDLDSVRDALRGREAVVHLAGIDDGNDFPDKDYFETNVQGAWNVLYASETSGVSKVVVASSTATLGLGYDRAPDYLPVDESHPLNPTDTYGLTKQVIETVCQCFVRRGRLSAVCLRPTLIVRPERERALLVQLSLANPDDDAPPDFVSPESIEPYGAMSATRTYVCSRDAATCFRLALEHETEPYDVFNVAAADGVGRLETLQRIEQVYGQLPEVQDPGRYEANPLASVLDTTRARTVLGWQPVCDWRTVEDNHRLPEH